MRRITLYHHRDCAKCRRIAGVHRRFDWLGRVAISTEDPPGGPPLVMGEIAVEDMATGEVFRGAEAVRRLFRQIPAYWVLLPVLRVPAVARRVERETRGCADGSCEARPVG